LSDLSLRGRIHCSLLGKNTVHKSLQFEQAKRLLNEVRAGKLFSTNPSRHAENTYARSGLDNLRRQSPTRHSGHLDISEEQVHGAALEAGYLAASAPLEASRPAHLRIRGSLESSAASGPRPPTTITVLNAGESLHIELVA
jgi:hypothetical protein